ncbi:MAG: 23S rRNA (guanosine(2251)-2'-O)-methyltransferase RlmB [Planctomycetaceae bacterium]
MAESRRRSSREPALLGNHQRCWLWGRHLVLETLRAGLWPVVELRLADNLSQEIERQAARLASEADVRVVRESTKRLSQRCGTQDHQGLLAKMRPFPYRLFDEVVTVADRHQALVMLDRIQDPHNFGAIIRAAEVLGMDGLIVGTEEQSEVTAAVARSSAGAVNHLPIAQAPDLVDAVQILRGRGVSIVAADAHAGTSPSARDLTIPTVFLLGNESSGVSGELLALSDAAVQIPQAGRIESLNAAVAAGILFYELQRQRKHPSSA